MEDTIDDFQLQIDTDPCQYLRIVTVTYGVTVSLDCNSLPQANLEQAESSPKNKHFLLSSNPGMASLLNDLTDKLPLLADNNSNEPNPINIVEDKDADGTLVDILIVDEVSRDMSMLTIQRIVEGVAQSCS